MTLKEVAIIVKGRVDERKTSTEPASCICSIEGAEMRTGRGTYASCCAFGATKTDARRELAEKLKGATLVIGGLLKKNQWEVTLPETITPGV